MKLSLKKLPKIIPKITSVLLIVVGVFMIMAGVASTIFTYTSVARENIITPADASIPETQVRGPLTLKAQSDIIRHHVLKMTGGKTYSEMPQKIQQLNAKGEVVRDSKGEPIMVANDARNIWITATTLTTALNLAIISYVISLLSIVIGFMFVLVGVSFRVLMARVVISI